MIKGNLLFDRLGWPLEIGDAVTVVGACNGRSYLYGAYGTVIRLLDDSVELALIEIGCDSTIDSIVTVEPFNLEFGRTDHVSCHNLFADVKMDIASRSVREAVTNAVKCSIISDELGREILDSWLQEKIGKA
ncbi:hypothetical protein [Nocardia sp. NPDC005745]|uniref:hypothetical protein n=1 Tax=Nocardia sp. NPDC005745 TaxID=3157061 RepID=UPI0033C2A5DE